MNQTITHREGARRQHRSLALFCSLKCRHFDWDGIMLEGNELRRILGLEKLEQSRLDLISEDFAEHFPFQWPESSSSSSLSKLILSTRPIQRGYEMHIGCLSFRKDPLDFVNEIIQTCLSPFLKQERNRSELAITALLGLLANGQLGLGDVFGSTPGPAAKCDALLDVRRQFPIKVHSRFPIN